MAGPWRLACRADPRSRRETGLPSGRLPRKPDARSTAVDQPCFSAPFFERSGLLTLPERWARAVGRVLEALLRRPHRRNGVWRPDRHLHYPVAAPRLARARASRGPFTAIPAALSNSVESAFEAR